MSDLLRMYQGVMRRTHRGHAWRAAQCAALLAVLVVGTSTGASADEISSWDQKVSRGFSGDEVEARKDKKRPNTFTVPRDPAERRRREREKAKHQLELERMKREWKREAEESERRWTWSRQLLIGVGGFSGVYWVSQEGDPDRLRTTNSSGIALRFTQGTADSFALEFATLIGRTGRATFDDPEDIRSANFARATAGLVLRLAGGRVVPLVNTGFGIQGTMYRSNNDKKAAFNGMYYIGAGLSFRVTERFVAGLSATFDRAATEQSLHGGLYLNYGWGR